jgi:hypothetical protein
MSTIVQELTFLLVLNMDTNTPEKRTGRLRIPKDSKAVPRDDPYVELLDGELSETEPRKMTPQRGDLYTKRLIEQARQTLQTEGANINKALFDLKAEVTRAERDLEKLGEENTRITEKIEMLMKREP